MIQITVQGYLTYQGLVGKRQVSLPAGSDLQDLLAGLREDLGEQIMEWVHPTRGEPEGNIIVLLNGRHLRSLPAGVNTVLKDGDQVAIFPTIMGG